MAGPAVLLLGVLEGLVFVQVRADRLDDLDASLAARAGAVAGYVEYDGAWELDDVPDFVRGPLSGFRVDDEAGVLLEEEGTLEGRRWTGSFAIESEGGPGRVVVTVAQDPAPVLAAVWSLVGRLAVVGAGLAGLALLVAAWLSRRIVASEDFRRLQAAWERQSAFVGDASHELRTPLAIIRTQAEVALRQERPPEQYRASLTAVLAAARRSQDLIEGLLVLARGDEPLDRSPVDLVALASEAAAEIPHKAGVGLGVEGPGAAVVLGDRRLLRVLLDNLLANALRHTEAGAVTVRIGETTGGWRLEVEDTGEGIAPEHLPHVFERFWRSDPARARAAGGAGLGLAIVRTVAEQHGGRVEARSTPGRGACFVVTLPGRPLSGDGDPARPG